MSDFYDCLGGHMVVWLVGGCCWISCQVASKTFKMIVTASRCHRGYRRQSDNWLSPSQNNMSEWNDMHAFLGLLLLWACTNKKLAIYVRQVQNSSVWVVEHSYPEIHEVFASEKTQDKISQLL